MADFDLLDSPEEIKKIDPLGMLAVVEMMPEMLSQAESLTAGVSFPEPKQYAQIVVLGMGGSAISGDILSDLLVSQSQAPVITNRGYSLPGFIGPDTLVFALSYSGGTEETLSAVKEAEKRGATLVCITSGGKLKEIAVANKCPSVLIPSGYQPRAALPYLLIPLIKSLEAMGLVPSAAEDIKEAIFVLQKLREENSMRKPGRGNPVKQMAKKIAGKIPVIFGVTGLTGAAAMRYKTQFNENSKATALFNLFPELDHNEIVNLFSLKRESNPFSLLVLRDEGESERIKKRIEITKSLLVKPLGGANEIFSRGKSKLARLFSLIFFGDLLSVYLAILQGIDPTLVEAISRLKKEMLR